MSNNKLRLGISTAVIGLGLGGLWAAPAHAHISLEKAGTHVSRDGDGNLKEGPCGKAGSKRGKNIYTYEPGSTITISLIETIPHPSYFRIAFDDDGDDGFKEPASIKPIDPKRKCPTGPGDHCGESDFYNNAAVLPGMDNLNPHIPSAGDYLNGPKYTWQVKLPNIECDNCTLQIIQVMEDDGPHGPYDPTPGVGVEDIYHQCIDIVLKRGAGDGGMTSSAGSGDGGAGSASSGTGTAGTNGGTGQAGSGTNGTTPSGMGNNTAVDGGSTSAGPAATDSGASSGCAIVAPGHSSRAGFSASLLLVGFGLWNVRARSRRRRSRRTGLAGRNV